MYICFTRFHLHKYGTLVAVARPFEFHFQTDVLLTPDCGHQHHLCSMQILAFT